MDRDELTELVLRLAEGRDVVDLTKLSMDVVREIPRRDLLDALHLTMPPYIDDVLRLDRNARLAPVPPGRTRPGRSRREIGHTSWKSRLDVFVTTDRGRVRLGACSLVDVQLQVDRRLAQAAGLVSEAEWWRSLAQAMETAKAATVADLPEDVVRPLLEKQAA